MRRRTPSLRRPGSQARPWKSAWHLNVYPRMALMALEERIARRPKDNDLRPCLALSGDAEHPHPLDILIIDLDYTPEADKDGVGRVFRDSLAATLKEAGAPMFSSTSGNSWHAILRMDADFVRLAREDGVEDRHPGKSEKKIGGCAVAEIFPAGAKRHVALRLGNPLDNSEEGLPIPRVSKVWLVRALNDARRVAEAGEMPTQQQTYVNGDESNPDPERLKVPWVIGRRGEYYGPDPEPPDDWVHRTLPGPRQVWPFAPHLRIATDAGKNSGNRWAKEIRDH